jgi:hypothetical protein
MFDTRKGAVAQTPTEIEALLRTLLPGTCFKVTYSRDAARYVSYLIDMLKSKVIELEDPSLFDRLDMVACNGSWLGHEHRAIKLKVPKERFDIPWFMERVACRLESVQLVPAT